MVQFAGSLLYKHKGHPSTSLRAGSGARRKSAENGAFVKLRDLHGYALLDTCRHTAPLPTQGYMSQQFRFVEQYREWFNSSKGLCRGDEE